MNHTSFGYSSHKDLLVISYTNEPNDIMMNELGALVNELSEPVLVAKTVIVSYPYNESYPSNSLDKIRYA